MKLDEFTAAMQRSATAMDKQARDTAMTQMLVAHQNKLGNLPGSPSEAALMHDSAMLPDSMQMEYGVIFTLQDGEIEVDLANIPDADDPPDRRGFLGRFLRHKSPSGDVPPGYGKIKVSWMSRGGHELLLHLRDKEIERIKFNLNGDNDA